MLYKGFSTYNRTKRFSVSDYELVKQDIFNHFNIKPGEKLMRPEFGTKVWDMLFEPFTDDIREAIASDVRSIVGYDPRIALEEIFVDEYEHGINLRLTIRFKTENLVDQLNLQFDRENQSVLRV
jgi:phage baseplate assembly protein W